MLKEILKNKDYLPVIKMNDGRESNTESQFDFANKFAPLLAKVRPDMRLVRNAYATRHAPPKKNLPLYDNISFCYCLGANLLPCTLHVECTINKKGMDEIKAWRRETFRFAKIPRARILANRRGKGVPFSG